MRTTNIDKLRLRIYTTAEKMGEAAAEHTVKLLKDALRRGDDANIILATGASQLTFLNAFKENKSLDWSKINVFHLDEYIGIPSDHPASFRKYLHERIIDEVQPKAAYFLQGDADDIPKEIERYENLLKNHPIDIACIGIGENGHLAFNEPSVADFEDDQIVKKVKLDEKSQRQQVGEGWFDGMEDVPTHALSLTIPAIMASKAISCVVPDARKTTAVRNTLYASISPDCPASILRTHPNAVLFLDEQSASGIKADPKNK